MNEKHVELFIQHKKALFGCAYSILGDKHNAMDVVHNVFIQFVKQDYDRIASNGHPERWLQAVCRNAALQFKVKFNRISYTDDYAVYDPFLVDRSTPMDNVMLNESIVKLKQAMKVLTEREQKIIKYRYYEDLPYKEICAIMKITIGNLSCSINKITKKIKAEFDRLDEIQTCEK